MAIAGGYVACQAAKLTIYSGKSTQTTVKGLQGMTLPLGFTQTTQEVSVIGTRIATKYATGAAYEDLETPYYFAKGDATQTYLSTCARQGTQIQDMWFWLDNTDFVALDLISDPGGYVMVGNFSSPKANKNEIFSGSCSIVIGGSHILFDKHGKASTAVFSITAGGAGVSATMASSDTTNYGFSADLGIVAGDTVIVHGVTGNLDTVYYLQVKTVSDSTLTFEDGVGNEATLPTTSAAASIYIHAGTPIEVDSEF